MTISTRTGFLIDMPGEWDGAEAETLRMKLGMSQALFGEHVLGVSEATVRKIEKQGRAYRFVNKVQRHMLDGWEPALRQNDGPQLDRRWGVRNRSAMQRVCEAEFKRLKATGMTDKEARKAMLDFNVRVLS